jgi:hypothetical protein
MLCEDFARDDNSFSLPAILRNSALTLKMAAEKSIQPMSRLRSPGLIEAEVGVVFGLSGNGMPVTK